MDNRTCPGCDHEPCISTEDCPGGRHYERMKARGTLLAVNPGWKDYTVVAPPRKPRSRSECIIDSLVWATCIIFALAVAVSYLSVML